MGELINGRTQEEIITGLKCEVPCSKCAYREHNFMKDDSCSAFVERDILALIERLESERDAALAKVPRWISVEERLPEDRKSVNVMFDYGVKTLGFLQDTKWYVVGALHQQFGIKYWSSLPEPPKEGE